MIIAAPQVLTPDGIVADVAVVVESGRIAEVGAAERPDVRLPDGILAPGLIDLQVNGCFGIDFADAAVDGWNLAARRLAETGVTAFLPTLVTAPLEELVAGLRRSAAVDGHGARVLGVHVEGPFLAPSRRGAHDADLFCDPTPERIDALLEPGTLALLTLAPERAGALDADRAAGRGGRRGQRRPQRCDRGRRDGGCGRRRTDGHARVQRAAGAPPSRARGGRCRAGR